MFDVIDKMMPSGLLSCLRERKSTMSRSGAYAGIDAFGVADATLSCALQHRLQLPTHPMPFRAATEWERHRALWCSDDDATAP